jgi:ubiquitin-protein ligase
MEKSNEIKIITKETINRLIKDITNIINSPLTDNGIYYQHDEEDMLKGYALIVGAEDTPYFGGFYLFEFMYPTDYPHSPPIIIYHTNSCGIRFNPNLYKNGKVCLSILNTWKGEQWTSCQTITTILLTLCMVLCKNPLLNEPGVKTDHKDVIKYNTIIEYSNINIAICDIINKSPNVYNTKFDIFYLIMKECFDKNYDKIIEFIIQRKIEQENNNDDKYICMSLYSLNVFVNYDKLYDKIVAIKSSYI